MNKIKWNIRRNTQVQMLKFNTRTMKTIYLSSKNGPLFSAVYSLSFEKEKNGLNWRVYQWIRLKKNISENWHCPSKKKVQHFHKNPADDDQIKTKLLFRSRSRTDSLGRWNNADLKLSARSIVVTYGQRRIEQQEANWQECQQMEQVFTIRHLFTALFSLSTAHTQT